MVSWPLTEKSSIPHGVWISPRTSTTGPKSTGPPFSRTVCRSQAWAQAALPSAKVTAKTAQQKGWWCQNREHAWGQTQTQERMPGPPLPMVCLGAPDVTTTLGTLGHLCRLDRAPPTTPIEGPSIQAGPSGSLWLQSAPDFRRVLSAHWDSTLLGLGFVVLLCQDFLEGKGHELIAISLVKLVLVLHPVQTQRMKEGRERLHHHEHPQRGARKHKEGDEHRANVIHVDGRHEHPIIEHRAELGVSQ
mmetsp:Transcript_3526/g.5946  ORF Transcript_3526/g.5946 Transcript_3526/m.5946 type:complete len:246 (+) Transcript_3526:710-1447(+)